MLNKIYTQEKYSREVAATFMRGGTSKGLMLIRRDLPKDKKKWDEIFLNAMGSPDHNGRQLNGLGGGISSLSKVCVVETSKDEQADIDFTFGQVSVSQPIVEYLGACGNMSAAVGPFATMRSLVATPSEGETIVTIRDVNTKKLIRSRFVMKSGVPCINGSTSISGVSGTGSPIWLDFINPSGTATEKLFPTGRPADKLNLDGRLISATLADVTTPCVFIPMSELDLDYPPLPAQLDSNKTLKMRLEKLRCQASCMMGLSTSNKNAEKLKSIPKVGLVHGPMPYETIGQVKQIAENFDLGVRMLSMGDAHRAVPITAGLCLAAISKIPGTVAHGLSEPKSENIKLGHPSGTLEVSAKVVKNSNKFKIEAVSVIRTARPLFDGRVFW